MSIVIDGIAFQQQSVGGITQIFNEILPIICEKDSSIRFQIFTTGSLLQPLPEHKNIEHIPLLNTYRLFRPQKIFHGLTKKINEYSIDRQFKYLDKAIWHSTYFTYVKHWKGPVVVTVHDMIYERFPDMFNKQEDVEFRKLKKQCILQADILISISETTKRDVVSILGIENDRCVVVPLACSKFYRVVDLSTQETPEMFHSQFFLYVGKRHHYKNFRLLLNAYSLWKRRNLVKIIIVGDEVWSNDELNLLSELKIRDSVYFIHHPKKEQLRKLYNQAIALVYPSFYEGFGIPLLEAMNCGCPIIASDIPSTREVANDVPIYFNPTEINQLHIAFEQALNENRENSRVEHGYKVAHEYSWNITAKKTLDIYRSLM